MKDLFKMEVGPFFEMAIQKVKTQEVGMKTPIFRVIQTIMPLRRRKQVRPEVLKERPLTVTSVVKMMTKTRKMERAPM